MLAHQSLALRAHAHEMSPLILASPMVAPPQRQRSARPRLTLDTHQNSSSSRMGKGSSLRLETLSAVSPTSRNTFQNSTSDEEVRTSATPSLHPTRPRLSIDSSVLQASPSREVPESRTPSSSSISSVSTLGSAVSASVPYTTSQVLFGILSNSPLLPRAKARIHWLAERPRFAAAKRVTFRTPLLEDVANTRYVLASWDPDSDSGPSSCCLEKDPAAPPCLSTRLPGQMVAHESTLSYEQPTGEALALRQRYTYARKLSHTRYPKVPRAGDKRDSSEEEDGSDTCPVTPVAGRKKRQRDWVWTLGAFPGNKDACSPSSHWATGGETMKGSASGVLVTDATTDERRTWAPATDLI